MSDIITAPRLPLTMLPTPIHELQHLSSQLGVRVLMKRDDLTSPGLGGNKVRKLEFLMGHAGAQGSDCVITGGGTHSNHARITAAVARHLGLEPFLIFYGNPVPREEATGNLFLDHLLDANILYTNDADRSSVDVGIARLSERLRGDGRRPYAIPRGGATARGSLGYVECAQELATQLTELQVLRAIVVVACGSCGTLAGLWVGLATSKLQVRVVGVTVSRPTSECRAQLRALAGALAAEFDYSCPEALPLIVDEYVGPGYGAPSRDGDAAIRLLARAEGVFLDPIYTGKAMAGLIDLAGRGLFGSCDAVVFIHTGGTPELFPRHAH